MKTIGTDMSLDVCKNEGYLMVKYDARKKFNINTQYNIFAYWPEYVIKENPENNEKRIDTFQSFTNLLETYNRHKEAINSFAETDKFIDFKDPTIYDFLNLASDISAYCGLD